MVTGVGELNAALKAGQAGMRVMELSNGARVLVAGANTATAVAGAAKAGWGAAGLGMAMAQLKNGSSGSSSGGGAGGKELPRYEGSKPKYHVNEAHVESSGKLNPNKEPLPKDAAKVYEKAVPDSPTNAKNWYGKNADGTVYRYSNANDGTAHFSGSDASADGIRNITPYATARLKAL